MVAKKKKPAYIWWSAVFTSAALLGFAIGGVVPWWTVFVPWAVYGLLVLTFLVGVFLLAFIGTLMIGYADWRDQKRREKTYER